MNSTYNTTDIETYALQPSRTTRTKGHTDSPFKRFLKKHKVTAVDLSFITISLGTITYLTFQSPLFIATLLCTAVFFLSFWQIVKTIPILSRFIGCRIRFWHIVTAIITVTWLLNLAEPAHALFLSRLEDFITDIATTASTIGEDGEAAISADVITLIFNLIRGVFLLAVAAASLFAYNQAQQGNDWRPIVSQVGLAFGIVIAVDVVTFLFTG